MLPVRLFSLPVQNYSGVCWLTILRALLDSSYPWTYAFSICSGANRPEMLQRTREILAPVLRVCPRCWLHLVLTESRSRPGRRKKQENEKLCPGFLPSQGCFEEVVTVRAQPGPKSFLGLARTLLSPPLEHLSVHPAWPLLQGEEVGAVKEKVFSFSGGG